MYFGVIDSIENNSIVACDLYNLVNFSFPATRKTGASFEQHIQTLINYYLLSDTSKNIHNISVTTSTDTAHSYQPEDPPTPTNMIDYLINGFKKYNVAWEVDSIHYENNALHVGTVLEQKTDRIQLKNNNYAFLNWEVYETQVGRNLENKLLIVDKASADSENPTVLSIWYLAQDKTVTQSMNDNVWMPTKTKVYVYDTTQTDPPTYQEIAQSELKANSYSHEINFDLDKTNNILTIDDIAIGLLATIVYNGKAYDSVLTGYVISSEHNFISLKFGHVRSTLSEALN